MSQNLTGLDKTSHLQHHLHIVLVSFGLLVSREPGAIVQQTATDTRLQIWRFLRFLRKNGIKTIIKQKNNLPSPKGKDKPLGFCYWFSGHLFGINWKGRRYFSLNYFDWHSPSGRNPEEIGCALKQTAGWCLVFSLSTEQHHWHWAQQVRLTVLLLGLDSSMRELT